MAGRHLFSELRAKMPPEVRAGVERKARALWRLIEHGRESGEPVEGEVLLKRLRSQGRLESGSQKSKETAQADATRLRTGC